MRPIKKAILASLGCALLAAPLQAAVVRQGSAVRDKEYRDPSLYVPSQHTPLSALKNAAQAAQLQQELVSLGVPEAGAFYDVAADRWGSLLPSEPLLAGGSDSATPAADETAFRHQVWNGLLAYLQRHEAVLRIDTDELGKAEMTISDGGALVQIWVPRRVAGVPVRDSGLVAGINHGNLALLGFQNWAPTLVSTDPSISAEQAKGVVAGHAAPFTFGAAVAKKGAHLELVPLSRPGGGYEFRLAWVISGRIDGDLGTWEGLVDAASGTLLSFVDRNDYAQVKKVVGGVYPVSNDGVPPDGVEVPGMSMPYADVLFPSGVKDYANSSGVLGCGGNPGPGGPRTQFMRTQLNGLYVRMHDDCAQTVNNGFLNEKSLFDSELPFDLGFGPGTDCAVPSGHAPGDTHASRSGFYELNRLIEQARGYLPANTWLQSQLTANMNIQDTCNAFWNGSTVNFFRSGGGCRNTGEIAAVFDHEWGHGLDNNGANPSVSVPGESIADIHAILRLQDSCLGRGVRAGNCNGYGDACTQCTGFRDLDFARHVSGQPHGITYIGTNCTAGQQRGPCNRETHCEGQIVAEVAWDLQARDLRQPPFNYDSNTALEATTRLFFLAAEPITNWYQCSGTPPTGDGCNAGGGYLNALLVDDDNGSLLDGTPHMTAIFNAFNRHQIACATPPVLNAGCAAGPTGAPTVTVTPRDQGATLSWTPVPGASRYAIYRTEGVRGCNFGKVKVGEVTGLSFTEDTGLANGNTYLYSVLPLGTAASCVGAMSACVSAVPVAGANLRAVRPPAIQVIGGDNDGVLDNCETARLRVTVENTGVVPLTNVRVVSATSPSHPGTVISTPLPATLSASLAPCAQAAANIDLSPHGMTQNQTFTAVVTITADQIAPFTRTLTYSISGVESDYSPVATRTYTFDTGMDNWTTSGTFVRVDGGGGNFYLASSSCLDDQCDIARSPVVRLTGTSTLSLVERYDTESPTPTPYDRGNVGILTQADNVRTTVSPDGGKRYDLLPPNDLSNGVCQTTDQPGWAADTSANCTPTNAFQSSSWTSNALNPGGVFTNQAAQISVNYGTDGGASGYGFHFDTVTLTNFLAQVPDAQTCTLAPGGPSRTKVKALEPKAPVRRARK